VNQPSTAPCPHAVGDLPTWGANALDRFRRELETADRPFPCTFAVSALRQGHLRFGFVDSASDEATWEPLPALLADYIATAPTIARITSLLVFFRDDGGERGLHWYEERFWAVLRYLRARDPAPWPADLPQDPDHPRWEFAFAGEPVFVVCNTPAYQRRQSRWSSEFLITFQPRMVFRGLEADTIRGQAARRTIRRRLANYDAVAPSPELLGYGQPGNREWAQYFLADTNDEPALERCPLHDATSSWR
jgi:FPC/CPF motif-containing protein YcgG